VPINREHLQRLIQQENERFIAEHPGSKALFEQAQKNLLAGGQSVIEEFELPWPVASLGCRAEYWFSPPPPRSGGQAAAAIDSQPDRYMHLAALNRGILMTPFHNMALISPDTREDDIDYHTQVFRECVAQLVG
jgi:glutamate-1-semialdehyde 2,1-aminomutase